MPVHLQGLASPPGGHSNPDGRTGAGGKPGQHPPGDGCGGEGCAYRAREAVPDPVSLHLCGGPRDPGTSHSGAEGASFTFPAQL